MDSKKKKSVAIIGAGPAGCMCAYFVSKNADVTLFDSSKPLHTLLYTGGGRCNLAYAEYDFKELAKFYPRGEKFLYSPFSKFSTIDTINFFKEIGIETYVQDDLRIFPKSNSAKEVREKFLTSIKKCNFKKEKVLGVNVAKNAGVNAGVNTNEIEERKKFLIRTVLNYYYFDVVVIATGGHSGFSLAENFGHKIIEPKPALTGLLTAENYNPLQGISLKNVSAKVIVNKKFIAELTDDLLFTNNGISGPLAFKISSICARFDYNKMNPLIIKLDFVQKKFDLQCLLNSNPKKDIKNLITEFIPKSFAEYILKNIGINPDKKCCEIDGKTRNLILKSLTDFEIKIISPAKEGEIVTSGGVCLDEIDSKTMQSKLVEGLYFCGEITDIDGFCGGFNLQNCWTTGFVAGNLN